MNVYYVVASSVQIAILTARASDDFDQSALSDQSACLQVRVQRDREIARPEARQAMKEIVDNIVTSLGVDGGKSPCPHSPHTGSAPEFRVTYHVGKGIAGMGVFIDEDVPDGAQIWMFDDKNVIFILEEDVDVLLSLLKDQPDEIIRTLIDWAYPWEGYCKERFNQSCMIFDKCDSRYINDGDEHAKDFGAETKRSRSNVVASGRIDESLIANGPLKANTEILEDYTRDALQWVPQWFNTFSKRALGERADNVLRGGMLCPGCSVE
jgi:hypothetical protein